MFEASLLLLLVGKGDVWLSSVVIVLVVIVLVLVDLVLLCRYIYNVVICYVI